MSKFHIHMMRVLHAFNNDENFDFDHISKFLNYREIRKSFHWKKWKKIMKIEIIFLKKNKIWKLIKRSFERVVITNRWMFKFKYDINERIFRYKTRWMIHEYKQKKTLIIMLFELKLWNQHSSKSCSFSSQNVVYTLNKWIS